MRPGCRFRARAAADRGHGITGRVSGADRTATARSVASFAQEYLDWAVAVFWEDVDDDADLDLDADNTPDEPYGVGHASWS